MLTTSRGTPWTSNGFRASWNRALRNAGIIGKTFHDLKGTFITRARRNGSSMEDIAQVTGNSVSSIKSVLESHYIASDSEVSDRVIMLMERNKK